MTRTGVVPEFSDLSDDLTDVPRARKLLERDGAVVLAGLESTADALVVAAAHLLGDRLRQLFPLRKRASRDAGPVHLHADSFHVQVDVGGVLQSRRDPDEDYLFLQCVDPASTGGDSFLADAYRFADACATDDPELWEFLTAVDVDLYGAWTDLRGLPSIPRIARHVEYTRAGRRIVRRTDGAVPLHRDPRSEWIRTMLGRYEEAVRKLESDLPRFPLGRGDILVVDNYRCWHGRDGHPGDRQVRILTLHSADAR